MRFRGARLQPRDRDYVAVVAFVVAGEAPERAKDLYATRKIEILRGHCMDLVTRSRVKRNRLAEYILATRKIALLNSIAQDHPEAAIPIHVLRPKRTHLQRNSQNRKQIARA